MLELLRLMQIGAYPRVELPPPIKPLSPRVVQVLDSLLEEGSPLVELALGDGCWLVHHPNRELAELSSLKLGMGGGQVLPWDQFKVELMGEFPEPPEPSNRAARRHPK